MTTSGGTPAPGRFDVKVEVSLRPGIADPAGATIERALPALGFEGVSGVSVGKAIRFQVEASDEPAARQQVEAMCERFLANPVIEDTTVTIEGSAPGAAVPQDPGAAVPQDPGAGVPQDS